MYSNKKSKLLQDRFSPEFLEFVDDTYNYLSKYSGSKLAESIGVSKQVLDQRKQKKGKNGNK